MERVYPKIKNISELGGKPTNFMGSRNEYLFTDDQVVQRLESRVYAQPNNITFTDANSSEPSTKFMLVSRTSTIDMSESYISFKATFAGAVNNSYIVPNLGYPLITALTIRVNNTEIFNAQNYELISGFIGNFYGSYQSKNEVMGVLAGSPAVYSSYDGMPPAAALDFGRIVENANVIGPAGQQNQLSYQTRLSRNLRSRIVLRNGTTPSIKEVRIYLSSIPIFNELLHNADFPLFAVDNMEISIRFAALQKCYTGLTNLMASSTVANAVTCTYSDICLVLSQKILVDSLRSNILARLESGIMINSLNIDYRSGIPDASNNLQIVVVPNLSHVLSGFVFFTQRNNLALSAAHAVPHTEIYYPFGSDNNATSAIYQEQEAGTTQVRFSVGGVLIPQYPFSSVAQRVSNAFDALKAIGVDPLYCNYDQLAFEKPIYGVSMLKSASPKAMRLSGVNISRGLSFEVTFSGGTAYTAAVAANCQYNVILTYVQITDLYLSGPIVAR